MDDSNLMPMSTDLTREKMEAVLKEWQAKIDELKAKSQKIAAEKKQEYLKNLQALERDQLQLKTKWEAIKDMGQDALEKAKSDLTKMSDQVKSAYDKFRQP